jgi:hypothetical protein
MSTHPDPGNRAEQIKKQIKEHFPEGVPPNLTAGRPIREAAGAIGSVDGGGGKWGGEPARQPRGRSGERPGNKSSDKW